MDEYEKIKNLSKKVTLCKRKRDDKLFAVRRESFENLKEGQKEKLIERINTIIKLTCSTRAIARLHNPMVVDHNIDLPVEYFGENNLQHIIEATKEGGKKLSEDFVWDVIGKICFELYDFHTMHCPIGHGKIKTSNIFVPSKGDIKLGLCSFDLNKTCTPSRDMYQLGVVIYEMLTLSPFDPKASKHSIERKLSGCDQSFEKLVLALTQEDDEKRPNVVYVLQILEVAVVVQRVKLAIANEQFDAEKKRVEMLESQLKHIEQN